MTISELPAGAPHPTLIFGERENEHIDKPKFEICYLNLYHFFTLSFADFLTSAFYNDGTSTEDGEKQPPCEKGE